MPSSKPRCRTSTEIGCAKRRRTCYFDPPSRDAQSPCRVPCNAVLTSARLGRDVAIKVLPATLDRSNELEELRTESTAGSARQLPSASGLYPPNRAQDELVALQYSSGGSRLRVDAHRR